LIARGKRGEWEKGTVERGSRQTLPPLLRRNKKRPFPCLKGEKGLSPRIGGASAPLAQKRRPVFIAKRGERRNFSSHVEMTFRYREIRKKNPVFSNWLGGKRSLPIPGKGFSPLSLLVLKERSGRFACSERRKKSEKGRGF